MAGTLTDRMSRGVCDGDYAAAVKVWVKAGEKRCGRKAAPFHSSLLYIGDTVGARKMTFRALFV